MARLKKQSKVDLVGLYHGTTLTNFIQICHDSAIQTSFGVVYLTQSFEKAFDYAVQNDPSCGVILQLQVDSINLKPDYDDLDNIWDYISEEDEDEWAAKDLDNLTWEDTIKLCGQCYYEGAIPTNLITGVKFVGPQTDALENLLGAKWRTSWNDPWLSFNEAQQLAFKTQEL